MKAFNLDVAVSPSHSLSSEKKTSGEVLNFTHNVTKVQFYTGTTNWNLLLIVISFSKHVQSEQIACNSAMYL